MRKVPPQPKKPEGLHCPHTLMPVGVERVALNRCHTALPGDLARSWIVGDVACNELFVANGLSDTMELGYIKHYCDRCC